MIDPQLRALPCDPPIDVQQFDTALVNLRQAERSIATTTAFMTDARDGLSAAPNDPEMQRAARMAALRMRATVATSVALFRGVGIAGDGAMAFTTKAPAGRFQPRHRQLSKAAATAIPHLACASVPTSSRPVASPTALRTS